MKIVQRLFAYSRRQSTLSMTAKQYDVNFFFMIAGSAISLHTTFMRPSCRSQEILGYFEEFRRNKKAFRLQ